MGTQAPIRQAPLRAMGVPKRELRTQFAALPWRKREGKVEVLLVTSRGTGRWIVPKGWPIDGETPAGAAATEAFEEAGVRGKVSEQALGFYTYAKAHKGDDLPCVVALFPLKVTEILDKWPEKNQRRRRWLSRKKAAELVAEPELARMIRQFRP